MKKLLFCLIVLIGCNNATNISSVQPIILDDPLIDAYEINYKELYKTQVIDNIKFFLQKHNRDWDANNINKLMEALIIGQQEFNINYKAVLAIISIESKFKITAVGDNKTSKDYGLTQQNSLYYEQRYLVAEIYLDKYDIEYSNSKFDIYKNIISCYILLDELRNHKDVNCDYEIIDAYNKGVKGMKRNNCTKYYNKFSEEFYNI